LLKKNAATKTKEMAPTVSSEVFDATCAIYGGSDKSPAALLGRLGPHLAAAIVVQLRESGSGFLGRRESARLPHRDHSREREHGVRTTKNSQTSGSGSCAARTTCSISAGHDTVAGAAHLTALTREAGVDRTSYEGTLSATDESTATYHVPVSEGNYTRPQDFLIPSYRLTVSHSDFGTRSALGASSRRTGTSMLAPCSSG